jgi:hypothetical protein
MLRQHLAHIGGVNDMAFSHPNNQQLCVITCGDDKAIKVWDAVIGTKQYTVEGHEAPVYSVCPHHKENVQLGMLMALPMVMEIGLERGFRKALSDFVIMQLQLASVFFTFSLGTKTHYYGHTLLHGGAKYRPTGRGFVVYHAKFADNYRFYSRSHFVKGLELMLLLIVYTV